MRVCACVRTRVSTHTHIDTSHRVGT